MTFYYVVGHNVLLRQFLVVKVIFFLLKAKTEMGTLVNHHFI